MAGGNLNVVDAEFVAYLLARADQIRAEGRSEGANETETRLRLEAEMRAVQQKLADVEASLREHREKLLAAATELEKMHLGLPETQIQQALDALRQGKTESADGLLAQAEIKGLGLAAEAAFQRGALAENIIRFGDAYEHYRRAADLDPTSARYANSAGFLAHKIGHYPEAKALYNRALGIWKSGGSTNQRATVLNNLAGLAIDLGRLDEAQRFAEDALTVQEGDAGTKLEDTARTMNTLAGIYQKQKKYDQAKTTFERALEMRKQVFGSDHPQVANTLNNYADVLLDLKSEALAELYHKEALAVRARTLPPRHPDIAQSLNNLAALYMHKKQVEEAEYLFSDALAIYEDTFGPSNPRVAVTLNNLGDLFRRSGRFYEAETSFSRALSILEVVFGPEHPDTLVVARNLQTLRMEQRALDSPPPHSERRHMH